MTQNKKEVKVMPAGLPILAAGILRFVLAMILPIYKAVVIIIVSAAAIAVMMIMFSMRKKQLAMQPPAPAVKVRAEELARKIDTCCRKLEGYAGQIKDRTVAASVTNIAGTMEKIADDVEKDPKDRNKVRKLANHYTSMIEELVEKYINLESQGQGGENISSAMDEIKKGLETVENAVKSLLDDLFSDDAMEVSADISVLEQLFKTEGAENRMDFDSAEKE